LALLLVGIYLASPASPLAERLPPVSCDSDDAAPDPDGDPDDVQPADGGELDLAILGRACLPSSGPPRLARISWHRAGELRAGHRGRLDRPPHPLT